MFQFAKWFIRRGVRVGMVALSIGILTWNHATPSLTRAQEFTESRPVITVETTFDEQTGHRPLVQVIVGTSASLTFLLDTGAGMVLLREDVARELKLPIARKTPPLKAGGVEFDRVAGPVALGVGKVRVPDASLFLLPRGALEGISPSLVSVHGVLGMNFLYQFATVLDPRRRECLLVPGGNLSSADRERLGFPPGALTMPLRVAEGTRTMMLVDTTLKGGARSFPLVVDTGSSVTVLPASVRRDGILKFTGSKVGITGVGGAMVADVATTSGLRVGEVSFGECIVRVARQATNEPDGRGKLGMDVLHRYRMLIDAPARKIYLVANTPRRRETPGDVSQP
jgi:hypothetical protein